MWSTSIPFKGIALLCLAHSCSCCRILSSSLSLPLLTCWNPDESAVPKEWRAVLLAGKLYACPSMTPVGYLLSFVQSSEGKPCSIMWRESISKIVSEALVTLISPNLCAYYTVLAAHDPVENIFVFKIISWKSENKSLMKRRALRALRLLLH